jgi:hypothetical protein
MYNTDIFSWARSVKKGGKLHLGVLDYVSMLSLIHMDVQIQYLGSVQHVLHHSLSWLLYWTKSQQTLLPYSTSLNFAGPKGHQRLNLYFLCEH